jgi:hypothetical protein
MPQDVTPQAILAENVQDCQELCAVEDGLIDTSHLEVSVFLAARSAFSHLLQAYQERCRPQKEANRDPTGLSRPKTPISHGGIEDRC